MPYRIKESIPELWAIVDNQGMICMSRGGSSSKSRIMVYDNETSAKRALSSTWSKQIIDDKNVAIKKIYMCDKRKEVTRK
jgi:hypothetical protein